MAKQGYADAMSEVNAEAPLGPAQRRIVETLKRVGSATTASLAEVLGVTTQAVRPPLAELSQRGFVKAAPIATGTPGRPPLGWVLSDAAFELFADRHGDLSVELIDAVREVLGTEALDQVLEERDRNQITAFEAELPVGADVATRVQVLAQVRTRHGYMADVTNVGTELVLTEHHCPVWAAAEACRGLCVNELKMFRSVIGPDASVQRTKHMLSGDRRCEYRITLQ